MLFNSFEFIFLFLPIAVVLHYLAARKSITAAVITTTATSLVFYAWWKPPYVLLPVLSIALNFALARRIVAVDRAARSRLVTVGVVANLLVLAYYKYADLVVSLIEWRSPHVPDVPLALSFTTFVQIAFLVELSRRPVLMPLPRYAMFVMFFPHLIAGPIVRWAELGRQLDDAARYRVNWDNVALGLTIFCFGLGKKILIADQLSPHVGTVFDAAAAGQAITALAAWGASVAFALQIYFDFSGYSDMAIGLGLLFNLRLPLNFAAPLRSTNITDFWRRWHVTLSRFLRDFVFVPLCRVRLGGSEHPAFGVLSAMMVTMIVGGLWHGANWTFLAWGAFHGVLLLIHHGWNTVRGHRETPTVWSDLTSWFLTFTAFVISIPMFRAADLSAMLTMLQAMAGFGGSSIAAGFNPLPDLSLISSGYVSEAFLRNWVGPYWSLQSTLSTAAALAVALFVPDTMEFTGYDENEPHPHWRRKLMPMWRPNVGWLAATAVLFAIVFPRMNQFTEFLYYQF
jgi:alginate O-acetyltransferase complex protein AlgI